MRPNKATLPSSRNSINRSRVRRGFLLITLILGLSWFALSPAPKAFGVSPPPDGGYPNLNTAEGNSALFSLTSGYSNTAVGNQALYSTTTGAGNTANGDRALFSNTTGNWNTANGVSALYSNTTGSYNVANGVSALFANTTGQNNTANGYFALISNTSGNTNTATGHAALQSNIDGFDNTANGDNALFSNTGGSQNTANGVFALYNNTTGYNNTAEGSFALLSNTTGAYNAANGAFALLNNTSGKNNSALGPYALYNNTTGSSNIGLGVNGGRNLTTGSNNIDIGALGGAGESNTIRLGRLGVQKIAYIQGIYGATVAGGIGVIVGSNGLLGTTSSSKRFKEEIKPMDKASEAILALKPVTFRYKKELDPEGIPQFGLVAEQVEKVNPNLVVRDADGKVYTVRYEAVNAMLLNEFLKAHRKVEEQEATINQVKSTLAKQEATIAQQQKDFQATVAKQQKEIKALTVSLKEQASQIQKVSGQLQVIKSAPQLVVNNQ
jgi:trimeric autotransporter adhesin